MQAKNLFCRNDVQAIDFLRKGSYAPDHVCFHVLRFVWIGNNYVVFKLQAIFTTKLVLYLNILYNASANFNF